MAFWGFEKKISYVFYSIFSAACTFPSLMIPINPGQSRECISAQRIARLPGKMIQCWKELCNCAIFSHSCLCLLWKGDLRPSWKCSKWPRADPLLFALPKPLPAIWEFPAVNPGLQTHQTHFVINSRVSHTPEYTLSWVRYWVSYTNIKRRVSFPLIFSRNPGEEIQVPSISLQTVFLLCSWKVGEQLSWCQGVH